MANIETVSWVREFTDTVELEDYYYDDLGSWTGVSNVIFRVPVPAWTTVQDFHAFVSDEWIKRGLWMRPREEPDVQEARRHRADRPLGGHYYLLQQLQSE